jgi:hypothetical protein
VELELLNEIGQLSIMYGHHLDLGFVLGDRVKRQQNRLLAHIVDGAARDLENLVVREEVAHVGHRDVGVAGGAGGARRWLALLRICLFYFFAVEAQFDFVVRVFVC